MTNRLARSVPFWVLLLASLASIGVGLWLVLTKVSEMSATLADGSAKAQLSRHYTTSLSYPRKLREPNF